MNDMRFIEPKSNRGKKVEWSISEDTCTIVKYYAEYTKYSESEVVDEFLKNLLNDPKFRTWISKKRNNKRISMLALMNRIVGISDGGQQT